MIPYVHGLPEKESCRLADPAATITELLHGDIAYPADSRVLEAGCGVCAQTLALSRSQPRCRLRMYGYFWLTGILLAVIGPLGDADVSIFALSTYDTDYVLVESNDWKQAVSVLQTSGHTFR